MTRRRMFSKPLHTIAAFAVGLLLGALALGQRPSPQDTPAEHARVESQRALAVAPMQESISPSRALPPSSTGMPPIGTEAAVVDGDKKPEPALFFAAGDGDTPRLQKLEEELYRLRGRILTLEQTLAWQQQQTAADPEREETGDDQAEEAPADTPQRRQEALVAAGVQPEQAVDIVWRQSQRALERLEIQDRARREGWFGNERYFDALSDFETDADDLRAEIGDAAYDRYLYNMGRFNRVIVDSVLQGSPAEQAGLIPGDVIVSYADERLFAWSELREATSAGARGETVQLRVLRGDDEVDLFVPRGPLGVRLDTATMEPLE